MMSVDIQGYVRIYMIRQYGQRYIVMDETSLVNKQNRQI